MDRLFPKAWASRFVSEASPTLRDWARARPFADAGAAVWRVDLTLGTPFSPERDSWLSDEERVRADRFLRVEDRARFIQSHEALRLILAGYGDQRPQDLIFVEEAGGKPTLASHWGANLHFNLSHSGAIALVAVSPKTRIGVDVEAIRPVDDPLAIARAHFHRREIAALMRIPRSLREATFFRLWTRKEAVVKAIDTGLMHPLDGFDVSAADRSIPSVAWEGADPMGTGWSLTDLNLGSEATGAVAVPLPHQTYRLHRLPEDWAVRV